MNPRRLLAFVMPVTFLLPSSAAQAQRSPRQSINVGAATRSFLLREPRNSASTLQRLPLVIVLHGGGGNAENAEQMTGFTRLVDSENIVVAYPDGSGRRPNRLLTWNARHCCAYAKERGTDDVAFIRSLIDTLVARGRVDPRRVYVTGMSNGGMMTHVLAQSLGDRIAAIAPVVGTIFGDEPSAIAPVPAIIFNGMMDKSVPYQGGPPGGLGRRGWDRPARPAEEQGQYWARANGCRGEPRRERRAGLTHLIWTCPTGREVELYAVTEGGHAWPGGRAGSRRGDTPSVAVNATQTMWDFFKAHVRN